MTAWAPADLWAFQRAVLSSDLPDAAVRLACLLSLNGHGTSGEDVVIDADALASALGCSPRTVWTRLHALTGTWVQQTAKPTRGVHGERGRRARYRLCVPGSYAADGRESRTRLPAVACSDGPSRVQNKAELRAADTLTGCTVPTSVGPTSVGPPATDLDRLAQVLATEKRWEPAWAQRVVRHVLDKAPQPPASPIAYLRTVIGKEPHRFAPTPTPPPHDRQQFARRRATAGDAAAGAAAARTALAQRTPKART